MASPSSSSTCATPTRPRWASSQGPSSFPLPELERRWVEVKDKNEIVCYCRSGKRSLQAATFLREKGVFNATSLEGGVIAWESFGGKLVPQKG